MPCPYVVISTAWKISLFSFIAIKTLPLVKREYPQGVGDGIFAVFKLPPLRSSLFVKRDSFSLLIPTKKEILHFRSG